MQAAKPVSEKVKAEAIYRKENKEWLRKSAKIALAIRRELREQGMSQQDLAGKMGLSPQYVGRILKGQENLTLETISKLEAAVGCPLMTAGHVEQVDTPASQIFLFCFPSSNMDAWNQSSSSPSKKERQSLSNS